jgi:outer membrane protein TolC
MRCPKVFPVVVTALLPFLAGSRSVTGAEPSERSMSLADCITTALEHNFDIAIERYNPMIAEANRRLVYADYDPQIRLGADYDHSEDPGGFDPVAGQYPNRINNSAALSAGVSGLLPSGMTYNISAGVSDAYGTSSSPITIGTNTFFVSRPYENTRGQVLIGDFRQPLLKNFWIDGTRLNLKLRTKDRQVSDLNLRLRILNTVSSVEQGYYDLVAARENVKSAEIAFQLARKLYEENKKRVEVGAMAQLDERQAQAQMASSEAAVLEARRAVDFAQNVLKNLLTDNYEAWHPVAIRPTDTLSALPVDLDVRQAWNQAFQLRPDLTALVIDLERRDLVTRFTRNQLFPPARRGRQHRFPRPGHGVQRRVGPDQSGLGAAARLRGGPDFPAQQPAGAGEPPGLAGRAGPGGTPAAAVPPADHGGGERRHSAGPILVRTDPGHAGSPAVRRGGPGGRGKEARQRKEHQFRSVATSARPHPGAPRRNPGAHGLQQGAGDGAAAAGHDPAQVRPGNGDAADDFDHLLRAEEVTPEPVDGGLRSVAAARARTRSVDAARSPGE